jgi:hypothetical protein
MNSKYVVRLSIVVLKGPCDLELIQILHREGEFAAQLALPPAASKSSVSMFFDWNKKRISFFFTKMFGYELMSFEKENSSSLVW